MFQSRCGVACDDCARKAEVDCQGCLAMALPFWGAECPVKSCAEGRGADHCGLCAEFPCAMLRDMGKDEGFDAAPKIALCRQWALEK